MWTLVLFSTWRYDWCDIDCENFCFSIRSYSHCSVFYLVTIINVKPLHVRWDVTVTVTFVIKGIESPVRQPNNLDLQLGTSELYEATVPGGGG